MPNVAQVVAMMRKAKGRVRVHKPGEMNRTEAAYSTHLDLLKITGEVLWYGFEAMTFKIAKDCRYTPDFAVMLADLSLEGHDVKGRRKGKDGKSEPWIEEHTLIKLRCAAEKFPIQFCAVWPEVGSIAWGRRDF